MITVESGKFIIPEDERFIGFTGDNTVIEKEILISHRAVPNSTYTLCLRFDDGSVRSVPLAAHSHGSDSLLTWNVVKEDLLSTGVITAQLKMTDGRGNVEHTTKDYFWAGSAVELDESGAEVEHITRSQLESSIEAAIADVEAESPYRDEDGFWRVYDRSAGEFIRTGYRGDLQVDGAMSSESRNPVENRAVTAYISEQIASVRADIGDIETALASV